MACCQKCGNTKPIKRRNKLRYCKRCGYLPNGRNLTREGKSMTTTVETGQKQPKNPIDSAIEKIFNGKIKQKEDGVSKAIETFLVAEEAYNLAKETIMQEEAELGKLKAEKERARKHVKSIKSE